MVSPWSAGAGDAAAGGPARNVDGAVVHGEFGEWVVQQVQVFGQLARERQPRDRARRLQASTRASTMRMALTRA
jgi:hypothetical protein